VRLTESGRIATARLTRRHTTCLDREYDMFHYFLEVQPCKDEYLSTCC
jgi:hypothetical protein